MRYLVGCSGSDHNVGAVGKNRRDDVYNVIRTVLIIGIGVDDNVGPHSQGRMDPALKCVRQSQVAPKADNVLNAQLFCNSHGPISAPIVDNHPFKDIYARKGSRERSEGNR
jgi:hypothetical protein